MPLKFYSPLRYPGGKTCIYRFVSSFLHENGLVGCSYAEPYAGGAGLALKLLVNGDVREVHLNDLDRRIVAFWRTVICRADDFCEWLERVEVTIQQWRFFKEVLSSKGVDDFELAKAVFFLNRTNVSGVIKGGPIGGYEQQGKYKLDVRFKKTELIERILNIAQHRGRIKITSFDGCEFVKRISKSRKQFFVYLDPPYVQKADGLYMNFYKEDDHRKLRETVKVMRKDWLVSYDNHDLIHHLYQDENRLCYRLSQSTSNRIGDEVLIFPRHLRAQESLEFLNTPVILV